MSTFQERPYIWNVMRNIANYDNALKKSVCFLLFLILFGCSKKPAIPDAGAQARSPEQAKGLPFQPTAVQTAESKEVQEIQNQAAALLKAKEFGKLDELAKKLRDSRESFSNGKWKLYYVYTGLYLAGRATDSEWGGHLALLREWVRARPSSITARVALADALVTYGWTARGGGYANTVSNSNWKLLFQRLKEGVDVLIQAKTLKEKCPRWWAVLLEAELGLHAKRSDYDATFNRAIQAWPDYETYYSSRAIFLLPRWRGTNGELEKDLEKSADQIGGAAGDMVYAQVVWSLHQSLVDATNILSQNNLSWERTKKGIEAIESRYSDSMAVANEAAHLAMLARDRPGARKYFDQTEGQIDLSSWRSTNDFIRFATGAYRGD